MPTRVWLMRHAQTDRPDIFHGFESDADLSELGYRQAQAVAPVVARFQPDVLISSGMRRARLTAEPIARACNLPLQVEPLLHERKVGSLVGTPAVPELGIWPDTLERWAAGETHFAPEGAESYDDLQRRLLPIWTRITSAHHAKKIVIVCHGIVCRVLMLSLLGYHPREWTRLGKIQNVCISELLLRDDQWHPERLVEVPEEVRLLSPH
jgi:probable phosphoglycerate mutase